MSSGKKSKKGTKKRAQRATSNVFAMFDQQEIQEFKEAFNMIDQNRDGFIDSEDLKDMFASLGKCPDEAYINTMLEEANGSTINFTMFLTLFGERMNGTDPEDVIRNAFACFDPENTGVINEEKLEDVLTLFGDRFDDDELDAMMKDCPCDKAGNIDYITYTQILKRGKKDEEDQQQH